jgi:hypothetical protein
MFPEFKLLDDSSPVLPDPGRMLTPEEEKRFEIMWSRRLEHKEGLRLEALLLERLKRCKSELEEMLELMNSHWNYEDHFYRYYHGSWKVYSTQQTTEQAVALLRKLLPERELNLMFEDLLKEGTGKDFDQNVDWDRHTRPILEAFCHAKFMIEMAVKYADLPTPPQPMPSGWAAFLYLYDLR